MHCRNCRRPVGNEPWDWWRTRQRIHFTVPLCSRLCAEILSEKHPMTDPNEIELAAMENAAEAAGGFIERIGKTDMASWSETEWQSFIGVVCGGYVDALIATQALTNESVAKVQTAA